MGLVKPESAVLSPRQDSLITIKDASFIFSQGSIPVLKDINLEVLRGSLSMIVSALGRGKSCLLKAIMGELPNDKGFILTSSVDTAYCAQTAWLPNSSVRNLVLGVANYDDTWYNTVINACILTQDIASLPDDDQAMIGSDGAALSGGQKQRLVSTTIACYGIGSKFLNES